jgi:type VI secretion system Hcp family effector
MNVRHGLLAWTAAAVMAAIPATALAAVDAFIWFEGVKGPSKYPGHDGAFELKDFSFGVENPTTIGSATGGAGAGKVKFNEFTIKKVSDSSSPMFHQAAASHRRFPTVTVQMRKAGGDPSQLTGYTFTDVTVSKIDQSGPGDEGPEESITFVYGKLVVQGAAGASSTALPPPGPVQPPPR